MYRLNEAMVMAASVNSGRTRPRGSPRMDAHGLALGGLHREEVDVDGEVQDQQRPEEERRHGVDHEGDPGQHVVDGLVAPDDLEDPERHGHDQGQDGGDAHQHERLGQALRDDGGDVLVHLVGVAEVVMPDEVL